MKLATPTLANARREHPMAHMGILRGNSIGMIRLPTIRHGLRGGVGRMGDEPVWLNLLSSIGGILG